MLRLGLEPAVEESSGSAACRDPSSSRPGTASDTVPPVSTIICDLGVVERGAVDVGGVGTEQRRLAHLLRPSVQPVATRRRRGSVIRAPASRASFQWSRVTSKSVNSGPGAARARVSIWSLRREVLGGGADEPARLALLPLAPPREPVGEHRPQPGVAAEPAPRRRCASGEAWMCDQSSRRGDPGVDRPERRQQVAGVGVLGPERRRQLVQHERDVAGPTLERHVGADVAQRPLPRCGGGCRRSPGITIIPVASMTSASPPSSPRSDRDDPVALDEDVAVGEVADLGIEAEHDPVR